MFCSNCGNKIPDGTNVCPTCTQNNSQQFNVQPAMQPFQQNNTQQMGLQTHPTPKCTCCGYTGEFKPGPMLTTNDWIWFLMLLFLAGVGFIFLAYRVITRMDPKKREKICPNCKSQNMFTYVY